MNCLGGGRQASSCLQDHNSQTRLVHFKEYGRSPWKPRGRKTGIFRILKQAGVPTESQQRWMEDRIESYGGSQTINDFDLPVE